MEGKTGREGLGTRRNGRKYWEKEDGKREEMGERTGK